MRLDRAYELQRLEDEDRIRANPIRPEDPYDAHRRGATSAARAIQERRQRNRAPGRTASATLRPQSGWRPHDDANQCVTAPWAR